MDQQQQSRWQLTRSQVLWTLGIVASLSIAVLIGYRYGITLWDWLKLLIVPAVIAGGGIWFNRQQRERELVIAREQRERDVEIADQRAQDEALQAYLDQMSQMLTDKDQPLHRAEPSDTLSTVARARTITALKRLDAKHKNSIMDFLRDSQLTCTGRCWGNGGRSGGGFRGGLGGYDKLSQPGGFLVRGNQQEGHLDRQEPR